MPGIVGIILSPIGSGETGPLAGARQIWAYVPVG